MPPRSRVANIRRESNCSVETEAAHEKLVKTAQQVHSVIFFHFILPSAYLELHTNELGLYMYVHLHIWAFSLYFTSVAFKNLPGSGDCWSFRCRLALRNSLLLKRSVKERIHYRNRSRSSPMRSFLTAVHLHPLALSTYKRLYPSSVSPFILFPLLLHSVLTWLVLLLH